MTLPAHGTYRHVAPGLDKLALRNLRRPESLAGKLSEWLVLAFLLVALIPPVLVRHESLTLVPKLSQISLIDASWLLDTSYKAAGGVWFGRDVAFTYGPLFQWLSSAPARWIGLSTGAIFATWYTLPLLVVILATFITSRLLLPETAAWRRALFVLVAVVFWSPPDVRVSFCLLAFAIFIRLTDAAATGGPLLLSAFASAAICVSAFWLSADTGLYTCAALLLCLVATMIVTPACRHVVTLAVIATIFFAALVLLTNVALLQLSDFSFWRSSLAIAGGYRWFEPSAMSKADKRLLFAILALGVLMFGAAWRWRRLDGIWTRRPSFLLSGLCLAFVMLQSALVRSDHVHLLLAIYPMIFLCGAIVMAGAGTRWWSALPPVMVAAITLMLAAPYPLFRPSNARLRYLLISHPMLTCPAGTEEFDGACLAPGDEQLLSNVSSYASLHTNPGDPIAIFPYETLFGMVSRRQVAGGVLQSYLVNGDYLTGLELADLRRSRPPFALYFPDGGLSIGIDSIPNFTRSPELWFYLLQHYRVAGSPVSGALGLVRDDGRAARLTLAKEQIADPLGPIQVRRRSTSVELPPLHWPEAGADFLKLRVRMDYPIWWRLRKPSKLTLQLSFGDGTDKFVQFVVEPNRTSDIWIFPWNEREMGTYFSDEEEKWHRGNRSDLTGLKLLINPYDWISVAPASITIENVEGVRVSMKPQTRLARRNFY